MHSPSRGKSELLYLCVSRRNKPWTAVSAFGKTGRKSPCPSSSKTSQPTRHPPVPITCWCEAGAEAWAGARLFFLFLRGPFADLSSPKPPHRAAPACLGLGAPSCLPLASVSPGGQAAACTYLPGSRQAPVPGAAPGGGGSSGQAWRQGGPWALRVRRSSRAQLLLTGHCTWAHRPPTAMSAWSIIKHINEGG